MSRRTMLAATAAAFLPPRSAPGGTGPRVVSLDYGLASTLLGLGVVPAGMSDLAGWDKWVMEPLMPPGVADLGASLEVNLEVLAALKPDLILATPYLDAQIPGLRTFAPVLRLETFRFTGTAILPALFAATRRLAAELDRESEGERFLAGAETVFDACRARLAARPRPPVALVNFMDARHVRVYGDPGLFHGVLERIGLRNAWTEHTGEWGFQTVAIEALARIGADDARLVALEPVAAGILARLGESPLWRSLPFARPDRLFILPPVLSFGMVNEAMRFARLLTGLLEKEA